MDSYKRRRPSPERDDRSDDNESFYRSKDSPIRTSKKTEGFFIKGLKKVTKPDSVDAREGSKKESYAARKDDSRAVDRRDARSGGSRSGGAGGSRFDGHKSTAPSNSEVRLPPKMEWTAELQRQEDELRSRKYDVLEEEDSDLEQSQKPEKPKKLKKSKKSHSPEARIKREVKEEPLDDADVPRIQVKDRNGSSKPRREGRDNDYSSDEDYDRDGRRRLHREGGGRSRSPERGRERSRDDKYDEDSRIYGSRRYRLDDQDRGRDRNGDRDHRDHRTRDGDEGRRRKPLSPERVEVKREPLSPSPVRGASASERRRDPGPPYVSVKEEERSDNEEEDAPGRGYSGLLSRDVKREVKREEEPFEGSVKHDGGLGRAAYKTEHGDVDGIVKREREHEGRRRSYADDGVKREHGERRGVEVKREYDSRREDGERKGERREERAGRGEPERLPEREGRGREGREGGGFRIPQPPQPGEDRPASDGAEEAPKPKEAPNLEYSGKLAAETNKVAGGVVLKHVPPADACMPNKVYRFYIFKNGNLLEDTYYLHRSDHFLFGRDPKVADVLSAHPSCSKQHAVLQFRRTTKNVGGKPVQDVRPYLMDLESINGTFINGEKLEAARYYELLEKDVVKFGQSSREFVLIHDKSRSNA